MALLLCRKRQNWLKIGADFIFIA